MDGLFNSKELAMSFIDEYSLKFDGESDLTRVKQSIRRAMVRLGILEDYVRKVNPETNHKCNYYSAQQRELIRNEPKFHDYLIDNSTDEKFRRGVRTKEFEKKKKACRDRYIESLGQQADDARYDYYDSTSFVGPGVVERRMAMMLTALFELFFTSFDEEQLRKDMNLDMEAYNLEYLDLKPEHIEAKERLAHPEGSYFRRRDAADHKEA